MRAVVGLIWAAAALAAIAGALVATTHALTLHTSMNAPDAGPTWACDLWLGLALLLAVGAAAPAAGVVLAVVDYARAGRSLRRLQAAAIPGSYRGIEFLRFPGEAVTLFTAGALRPHIYASSAAEDALSEEAFYAALLHERAHCVRGDVLHRLALHGTVRAFGRLPGVSGGVAAIVLRSEQRADQTAIASGADRRALFNAIVMASSGRAGMPQLSDGIVLPRLEALTGGTGRNSRRAWAAPLAIGGALVFPPAAAHLLAWACAAWLTHS